MAARPSPDWSNCFRMSASRRAYKSCGAGTSARDATSFRDANDTAVVVTPMQECKQSSVASQQILAWARLEQKNVETWGCVAQAGAHMEAAREPPPSPHAVLPFRSY